MEVLAPILLIVGGIWVIGRISRGFASHPLNAPQGRTASAFSHSVDSFLLDNSAVSDDTAQEPGAFTVGEPDDFAPPQINAIEQSPAGINESLAPIAGGCCGGTEKSGGEAPAPRAPAVHAPGVPPVATPIVPHPVRAPSKFRNPFRRPSGGARFSQGTARPGSGGFLSR